MKLVVNMGIRIVQKAKQVGAAAHSPEAKVRAQPFLVEAPTWPPAEAERAEFKWPHRDGRHLEMG